MNYEIINIELEDYSDIFDKPDSYMIHFELKREGGAISDRFSEHVNYAYGKFSLETIDSNLRSATPGWSEIEAFLGLGDWSEESDNIEDALQSWLDEQENTGLAAERIEGNKDGAEFRLIRRTLHKTQAELGELWGVDRMTGSRWENGKVRPVPKWAMRLIRMEKIRFDAMYDGE